MTKKEVAQHIFKTYPNQDEAFITSDKRGFLEEHAADSYAQRLADRKVQKFTRGEDKPETIQPPKGQELISDTTAALGGPPKDVTDIDVTDATEVKEVKLDRLNKAELLDLAKDLGVTEENTKKEIIAAIEADKAKAEQSNEGGEGAGEGGDGAGKGEGAGEGDN